MPMDNVFKVTVNENLTFDLTDLALDQVHRITIP